MRKFRVQNSLRLEFRYAVRGWSFCNNKMLLGKIKQAESLAPLSEQEQEFVDMMKTYVKEEK